MEVRAQCCFFVTVGVVTAETGVDEAATLIDFHTASVTTDDVVHTGVDIRSTQNHLSHLFSVT